MLHVHGGCWIFLSHSSHDIEKVRLVRNEFERLGHNPLAFHLKCLSTDTEAGRHELDSLIKREIDAREWFVFCESPDAAKSPYVKEEHAYILNSGKDHVWTIDMTADIPSILNQVRKISADIEVFVSYSRRDWKMVQPLIRALVKKDYSVWMDNINSLSGRDWHAQLPDAGIIRCTYKGFYIIVITQESVKSSDVKDELAFAYIHGARIVPIILGNPSIPDDIRLLIMKFVCLTIPTTNPTEEDFAKVVDNLDSFVMERIAEGNFPNRSPDIRPKEQP